MSLFTLLIEFRTFMPLLLHLFPLADGPLDTEGGDAHAGGILEAGFVLQFAGFFGGHFAFGDFFVAFIAGFDRAVDAVGGVDGGDGREASCDDCTDKMSVAFPHDTEAHHERERGSIYTFEHLYPYS